MGSIHTAIKVVPGGTFNISPVNTSPFKIGDPMPAGGTPAFPPITVPGFPEFNLAVPNNFRTPAGNTPPIPLPASIDGVPMQDVVNDPTRLLQQAIRGPFIEEMVVLQVATEATLNAESAVLFATLWVEKVKHPAHHFMQLQYVQTVLLNFPIIPPTGPPIPFSWPHVSVATLRKTSAGQ
jgi:hypothetical protein